MILRITFIFLILIYINTLKAQIENVIWQNCLGVEAGYNETYSIEKSEDGYLFGINIQGDGPGVTDYHGKSDVWVVNTDHSGNIIWEKCFGGSEGDGSYKIIKIDENTYYLLNFSVSSEHLTLKNLINNTYFHRF